MTRHKFAFLLPALAWVGTAGPGTKPQISGKLFNYLAKTNITARNLDGLSMRTSKSLSTANTQKRFGELGLDIIASTPNALVAHIKNQTEKRGHVIRERGIKAD